MKRSTLITIAVLLLLAGISVTVYFNKNRKSTIDKEASDFKIVDTAVVDKIFLADKENHSATVERTPQGWMVAGKYPVRPDVIIELLSTLKNVDVKSPVSKASKENVIRQMSTQSTKVEVYSKGKKIKQFYVGAPTKDYTGTYMLLSDPDSGENYADPFVTYIPGFEGYLTTRFITTVNEWRSTLVINFTPPDMKSLNFEYHETPDSSFTIDLADANTFTLKDSKHQPLNYDMLKMKQYLAYFQNVHYDILLNTTKHGHLIDSLNRALPFATLTIRDKQNNPYIYNFLHMEASVGKNEKYGVDYKYDPDKLYMKFNNDKEVSVIQYFVFGKMLQTVAYFGHPNTVKK